MKTVNFIREGGFVYYCTEPGDMSGEYIPASYAPALAAEVTALKAQVEAMREAAAGLVAYRDKAGPLNFQLEKADDFIELLRAVLGEPPDVAFGEWAAANGYDVEDEAQLQAAIEAYGGEK